MPSQDHFHLILFFYREKTILIGSTFVPTWRHNTNTKNIIGGAFKDNTFIFLKLVQIFVYNCLNMSKSRIFLSNEVGINMCYPRVRSNNTVTNSQRLKLTFQWTTLPGILPRPTYLSTYLEQHYLESHLCLKHVERYFCQGERVRKKANCCWLQRMVLPRRRKDIV